MLNGGLLRVGLNNVELEVVGLRNRLDGGGAGVVLKQKALASNLPIEIEKGRQTLPLVKRVPKAILSTISKMSR